MNPDEIRLLIQERNLLLQEIAILRDGATEDDSQTTLTRLTAENVRFRAEATKWKRHSRKHEERMRRLKSILNETADYL